MNFNGFAKGAVVSLTFVLMAGCASDGAQETQVEETTPPPVEETVVETPTESVPTAEELAAERDAQIRQTRTIYFDFDKSDLRGEFDEVLAAHGRFIANNPNLTVTIEGHADERGTPEYNIALGERRAKAVLEIFKSYGANETQIQVVSYGEEKPIAFSRDEDSWAQNRRAEIVYNQ
ncbi:MAG: peptidoglycan-associated lipoprotein Pal [Pseudomonadota bacterium]